MCDKITYPFPNFHPTLYNATLWLLVKWVQLVCPDSLVFMLELIALKWFLLPALSLSTTTLVSQIVEHTEIDEHMEKILEN